MQHSLMLVSQDYLGSRHHSRPRRLRWLLMALAGCLVITASLVAYMLGVFTRNARPYEALDVYMSAVTTGDRDALKSALADGTRHDDLIDRHASKPMTPTSVSMEQMTSEVWWSVGDSV